MKLYSILHKGINRTVGPITQALGWDWLTWTKISPRDDLEEIGSAYGGWVVPTELFDSSSICYCVGCGEDITFDLGLIERFGSRVYGFDPTPRAIEHVAACVPDDSPYTFVPTGVWDQEDRLRFFRPANPAHVSHSLVNLQGTDDFVEIDVKSIMTVMTELGHATVDFIKLDIEGAEYRVIASILEHQLDIPTICVEFDEWYSPLDRGFAQRIRKTVRSLTSSGYQLVAAQGNGNYTFVRPD